MTEMALVNPSIPVLEPLADTGAYRRALGSFATGVTVVTARDAKGQIFGRTINSFTSVSLAPPTILWCLGAHANHGDVYQSATHFSLSVLSGQDKDLAMRFAGKGDQQLGEDDFLHLGDNWASLKAGLCHFRVRQTQKVMAGDHFVIFGEVEHYADAATGSHHDSTNLDGLGFFRGQFLPLPAPTIR